jgi:hypothetical protein
MTDVEDLQSRWGIEGKQLQDHRLHRLHRLFSVLCVKTTGFGGGFVSFLAAASCSLSGRVFLAYTACRLPITVQYPSSVPSQLNRPLSYRLPFRELGLAIELQALPIVADRIAVCRIGKRRELRRTIDLLLQHVLLNQEIVETWMPQAQHPTESWQAHQGINDIVLATALMPETVLLVR